MKKFLILFLCLVLTGCATSGINSTIKKYRAEAPRIKIGDSKEEVLAILLPTQEGLRVYQSKVPESYKEDDDLIEIYYMRSGRQPDGLTTDDEFIPYVFTNGVLTGIGWTVLGGPKTQGQVAQPPAHISHTTVIR